MINELRIRLAEFLGTTLIGTGYFYFDFWTLIHIFSGFLVMSLIFKFLNRLGNTSKFILLFIFVFFWEIFELSASWIKLELSIDIIFDLIMGMFGGWIYYYIKNKQI